MINNDACVLWQVSAKEKIDDNHFECHLILEDKDRTVVGLSINDLDNKQKDWLRLVHLKPPFKGLSGSDVPIRLNLSLFISCFMDFEAIQQIKPEIKCVYLWVAAKSQEVNLELVYPLSDIKEVEPRASNKIFVQLYPKIPSQRYIDLEDDLEKFEEFRDFLDNIKAKPKYTKAVKKSKFAMQPVVKDKSSQNISNNKHNKNHCDTELLDNEKANTIWYVFSEQDLDDLVEGFRDWERVHGKSTLIARLPEALTCKIGSGFDIIFWTSGKGISNMILDDRPPRHTMIVSLIKKNTASISHGIGYCLQRPTSLDKVWTYQKWHTFECQNNEISNVAVVTL